MKLSERIREAAAFIRARSPSSPRVAIVLGSGMEGLADEIEKQVVLQSAEIPHFCAPTVEGHPGRLVIGTLAGVPVAVLQGRPHLYEGYDEASTVIHVWTLHDLGCHSIVLTNASGALNPYFWPGDIMLITDHINLPGLTGRNPLSSSYCPELGTRFVDMGDAYDPSLAALAIEVAFDLNIGLRRGVYVMVGGPSYETQAELKFIRSVGGDAVGMSTANEVVAARQCGLRVLGLSGISNLAIRAMPSQLTHAEVLAVGEILRPKLRRLIGGIVRRIDSTATQSESGG